MSAKEKVHDAAGNSSDRKVIMPGSASPKGKILSMHPLIEGDRFFWDRGVWDDDKCREVGEAEAVILPQTVEREFYHLCRKMCPHVFPNYDLRFRWEGKVGDTLAFWTHGASHPYTLVFPKVETLLGDHPDMDHLTPELPAFPFVLKGARGGEGTNVWLIDNEKELEKRLQSLLSFELQGRSGFVIQEYIPGLERDLRVVVIGDRVFSYWRRAGGFLHNVSRGGEVDRESDPHLQERGRQGVMEFCQRSGVNLAGFDLVFIPGKPEPVFLEINYTFGRSGLGGSEKFYILLREAVKQWLVKTVFK